MVAQETALLRRNGHQVTVYRRSNNEIDDLPFGQRLGLISRIISADDSKAAVLRLLREHRPDLVHVHNTFLMISPAVYEVCQQEHVPVIQTLHNYRLLCPAATLYRDDGPCEECATVSLFRSVRHGCYRDSRIMSGAIALMLQAHRSRQTWNRQIDAYIAISGFLKEKFVEAGLPAARITVKPNFVEQDPGERCCSGGYALYLGRLSREKGLLTLLQAWERLSVPVPLLIAGDGPMRHRLEAEVASRGIPCVRFVGQLNRRQAYEAIKKAAFLVVPSLWPEPFGLVVAEAFACGTPVLGAYIGALQEMVEDQKTGLHFASGDPAALAQKVAWAWRHSHEMASMGKTARRIYEERYTAATNYELLIRIYESSIDTHSRAAKSFPTAA